MDTLKSIFFPAGCKYKGLANQGSTCYLNSVLQMLFMTKEFREAVERHSCEDGSLDFHLKNLFIDLKKHTGYTYLITKTLGISSGYVQRDAAECLENILSSLTSSEASQLFKGTLALENKCSKCEMETNSSDPFWNLPLEMANSDKDYSLADGIIKFFSESELSGPDQLYCEHCATKSDATTKLEVEHHPEVLTLLLKRFKFDYSLMDYEKIKRSVHIPMWLEIPPTGHQSQTYQLYAYVEHVGELRHGHYTVTIKPQDDDKWYNFNDIWVKESDYQPFQLGFEETNGHAYLLFYRKIHATEVVTQDINKVSTSESSKPEISQQSDVETKIQDDEEAAAGNNLNVDIEKTGEKPVSIVGDQPDDGTEADKDEDQKNLITNHSRIKTPSIFTNLGSNDDLKQSHVEESDGQNTPSNILPEYNREIVNGVGKERNSCTSVHKEEDKQNITTHQSKTETPKNLTKFDLCQWGPGSELKCEKTLYNVSSSSQDHKTSVDEHKDKENMMTHQSRTETPRLWTKSDLSWWVPGNGLRCDLKMLYNVSSGSTDHRTSDHEDKKMMTHQSSSETFCIGSQRVLKKIFFCKTQTQNDKEEFISDHQTSNISQNCKQSFCNSREDERHKQQIEGKNTLDEERKQCSHTGGMDLANKGSEKDQQHVTSSDDNKLRCSIIGRYSGRQHEFLKMESEGLTKLYLILKKKTLPIRAHGANLNKHSQNMNSKQNVCEKLDPKCAAQFTEEKKSVKLINDPVNVSPGKECQPTLDCVQSCIQQENKDKVDLDVKCDPTTGDVDLLLNDLQNMSLKDSAGPLENGKKPHRKS